LLKITYMIPGFLYGRYIGTLYLYALYVLSGSVLVFNFFVLGIFYSFMSKFCLILKCTYSVIKEFVQ